MKILSKTLLSGIIGLAIITAAWSGLVSANTEFVTDIVALDFNEQDHLVLRAKKKSWRVMSTLSWE